MNIGKTPIKEMTWIKNLELLDQNKEKILKNIDKYFLNEEEKISLGIYLQTGKIEDIDFLKKIQDKVYNPLLEIERVAEIYANVPAEVQAINFKKQIEEAIAIGSPDVPGFIGNLDYIEMLNLYQKKGGNIDDLRKPNGESISYLELYELDLQKKKKEAQDSLDVIEEFKDKSYFEFIEKNGLFKGFYKISNFEKAGGNLLDLKMSNGSPLTQNKYIDLQKIYNTNQAKECLLSAENLCESGEVFDYPYSILEEFKRTVGEINLLKTKNGDVLTEEYLNELYLKSWAFTIKESVKEMENGTAEHGGLPSYEISDYLKEGGKIEWLGKSKDDNPITKEYIDYLKLD